MYTPQINTPFSGLRLALSDAHSEGQPPPSEDDEGVPSRLGCLADVRAFIVEDSAIILESLTASLEELTPVRVIGSASGEVAAMRELNQLDGEVDLVIIDVFLKQGSGLGVLRNLADGRLSAKRVILTNYATSDMRERCGALGAHRVFDKSCDLDDLMAYCTRLSNGGEDATPGGAVA